MEDYKKAEAEIDSLYKKIEREHPHFNKVKLFRIFEQKFDVLIEKKDYSSVKKLKEDLTTQYINYKDPNLAESKLRLHYKGLIMLYHQSWNLIEQGKQNVLNDPAFTRETLWAAIKEFKERGVDRYYKELSKLYLIRGDICSYFGLFHEAHDNYNAGITLIGDELS